MTIMDKEESWNSFKLCINDYCIAMQTALYFLTPDLGEFIQKTPEFLLNKTKEIHSLLLKNKGKVYLDGIEYAHRYYMEAEIRSASVDQIKVVATLANILTRKDQDNKNLYNLATLICLDKMLADCGMRLPPEVHKLLWSYCIKGKMSKSIVFGMYLPFKVLEAHSELGINTFSSSEEKENVMLSYSTENVYQIISKYPKVRDRYSRTEDGMHPLILI